MSRVFVTSDSHFHHRRVLEFEAEARPFSSVEEMNEVLVDRWNAVVTKRDLVWHLGDVCFGRIENLEILSRLNGQKKLVLGNHDTHSAGVYLKYFRDVRGCLAYDSCILTHIPIHPSQFYRFEANIHGHLHSKVVTNTVSYPLGWGPAGSVPDPENSRDVAYEPDTRYINVSVEHTNLTPIEWSDIRRMLNERKARS